MCVKTHLFENPETLDMIRGLAVLLVFMSHVDAYRVIHLWPFYYPAVKNLIGELGVSLFFILSGILIWHSARRLLNQPHGMVVYFIHRITRIYPVYLTCIIFMCFSAKLFIGVGGLRPEADMFTVLRHLFMTQDLPPRVSRDLNPVMWSLTYEMLFYCIVPLLVRLKAHNLQFLIVSNIFCFILAYWANFNWMVKFFIYWPLFSIGMLISQYQYVASRLFCVVILVSGFYLKFCFPILPYGQHLIAISLVFYLCMQTKSKGLLVTGLSKIGLVSYSIYLWHYPLIELYGGYTARYPFWVNHLGFRSFVFVLAIGAVAWLSYQNIERPFMTNVRKKWIRYVTNNS